MLVLFLFLVTGYNEMLVLFLFLVTGYNEMLVLFLFLVTGYNEMLVLFSILLTIACVALFNKVRALTTALVLLQKSSPTYSFVTP
jgi:hypothetical protein